MAQIYIKHQNGGGEWVWVNEAQARAKLGIPESAPKPSPVGPVAKAGGVGCFGVLAFVFIVISSLFGWNKTEPTAAPEPSPSPTPVVQAQPGYAPRAELVRLPNH